MRAAAYVGNHTIEVTEAEARPPQAGEVQIEVAYVGICGTDLHILHGAMDARVQLPAVIGHEMSGLIAAVGVDVTGWSIGDRVTVMPLDWDDTCPACTAGHHHICQNLDFVGIDSPGALQHRWNVRAELLVAVPAGVSLEQAALVEPVAVAVHDVRRSELTAGDRVVVLGGGPIGALIGLVARAAGAEVLLSEPDPGRRSVVAALGLNACDPTATDLAARIENWTEGAGADVVFEVSGAAPAVLTATSLARVRGTVVIVAIHSKPVPVDLQRVFWRELRVLGARVYERRDFERATELLAGDVLPAGGLITEIVDLEHITDAFRTLESGAAMKVLVDVNGGHA
jgi:(R,R)-butanediol dehydrogenase/meso-butanediol dehydrogenase/diacetyl reductase